MKSFIINRAIILLALHTLHHHPAAFVIRTPTITTRHHALSGIEGLLPAPHKRSVITIRRVHSNDCDESAHHDRDDHQQHQSVNNIEDDDYFMSLALEQAHQAFDALEIPVGAVLVMNDGKILASARNRVEETGDASAHAELECLRQAAALGRESHWRMIDCTLYVTLEPCLMCLGSIQSFRVKRVVYGAKNHLLGAIESYIKVLDHRHPFHEVEVLGGVKAEECGLLMKQFFATRRRQSSRAEAWQRADHRKAGRTNQTNSSSMLQLPPIQCL